jgi:integrase
VEWTAAIARRTSDLDSILAPAFDDAAEAFLKTGLRGRAPKTQDGRRYQIEALCKHFGELRLDRIGTPEVVAWWDSFVAESGRDIRTGKSYLDALSLLFKHAAKTIPGLENPVSTARQEILSELQNTAGFRARDEGNKNPFGIDELRAFLPQLEASRNPDLILTVMLQYEAGLRVGESLGLQWGDCWYGKDENDTSRHLRIERSRVGNSTGHTKSGRSREVAMSRRLRRLLQNRYMALGRPGAESFVIEQSWPKYIRERIGRVYKAAGIEPHKLKDLRDTFATLQVTHGIVLKWISLQLGHSNVGITERHYARWMAQDGYQNPWQVPTGGLPVDLFAELDLWSATLTPLYATRKVKVPGIKVRTNINPRSGTSRSLPCGSTGRGSPSVRRVAPSSDPSGGTRSIR